jgi:hypothetical protein
MACTQTTFLDPTNLLLTSGGMTTFEAVCLFGALACAAVVVSVRRAEDAPAPEAEAAAA